ncbi:ImmA/IrrE family metallo-endopeptidase [Metaclostridioides mangenotii]|uniref:IrrE N-terminal-like domain-containing protein n=1 Tax=Metaclostridioides mangenotii TaxID=1540 RepID=A0ABS4EBQ1_9FIRM|nr:hypothetical protein [Clostridioides mangenotii]MBP1855368.1 hypothetical protein [Clostridioides mangenotii]
MVGDVLNTFEELENEAYENNILVKEIEFDSGAKGLYKNNKIALNKFKLQTLAEKSCTLAEELAHHHTSYGDILDLDDIESSKQEYRARLYSYNKLVSLKGLVDAHKANCRNIYEMAEYLNVTVEFLSEALECYKSKYGLSAELDNYTIVFCKGSEDNETFGYKVYEKIENF